MASICCSPPDSRPAACRLRSARRGNSVKTRSRASAVCAGPRRPRPRPPLRRFSSTVRPAKTRRPSGTWTTTRPYGGDGVTAVQDGTAVADPAGGDRAAVQAERARHGTQQRALAGAVGAEQRDHAAVRHGQGHIAEGGDGTPGTSSVHMLDVQGGRVVRWCFGHRGSWGPGRRAARARGGEGSSRQHGWPKRVQERGHGRCGGPAGTRGGCAGAQR